MADEIQSMVSETGLNEKEAAQFVERKKKTRADYEDVRDNMKKVKVLDTGELQLPGGKIIGHRQWVKEYNQTLPLFDRAERQVMQKLSIEYK